MRTFEFEKVVIRLKATARGQEFISRTVRINGEMKTHTCIQAQNVPPPIIHPHPHTHTPPNTQGLISEEMGAFDLKHY